jgi:hypothetical protein
MSVIANRPSGDHVKLTTGAVRLESNLAGDPLRSLQTKTSPFAPPAASLEPSGLKHTNDSRAASDFSSRGSNGGSVRDDEPQPLNRPAQITGMIGKKR